jgi:hypothetical protein
MLCGEAEADKSRGKCKDVLARVVPSHSHKHRHAIRLEHSLAMSLVLRAEGQQRPAAHGLHAEALWMRPHSIQDRR